MKTNLTIACSILALAAASSYAGPNLLNSSWDVNGALGNGTEQLITDTPGATYLFSFDYNGFGTIPPTLYVWWDYGTASQTLPSAVVVQDGAHSLSVDLTGSGSDDLFLQVESNGPITPSGVTMSDFSLVEVTSGVPDAGSASTLLGGGLLGLAALRRKLS